MKNSIKKHVSIFLLIFFLISTLMSCVGNPASGNDKTQMGDDSAEHIHDFIQKSGESGSFEECIICGFRKNETLTPNDENKTPPEENLLPENSKILSSDSEMVVAMIEFLHNLFTEATMITNLENKIDQINYGVQPVLLDFSSSSPYFVCAYYNVQHVEERGIYCCATEYTWVKFENEEDITEYYGDEKFYLSFRVNDTKVVKNVLPDNEYIPTGATHFQLHVTAQGIVVPSDFERIFLYLDNSPQNNLYYSTDVYNNIARTIPCVNLDGRYFITTPLYSIKSDGSCVNYDLNATFGKYYDPLIEIMITDKYCENGGSGRIDHYGLFDIEEFVKKVVNV